jgi:acyl transferase domain-containing protein/NAD(P)H-dependent flavin oxidoreductase YrpB (nitropropane dioxygenase family)/NAD(P)-dependent dehydrogenase (short-subunit alcohol dehydrogenase family)
VGPRFNRQLVIGITPFNQPNPQLVAAIERAGGLGVLDLGRDLGRARTALQQAMRWAPGSFGVRISGGCSFDLADLPERVDTIVAGQGAPWFPEAAASRMVIAEVCSLSEARSALEAGAFGLIARGSEGGGRVGELSTFVLLQHLLAELEVPVWAAGGIGLHTAAAAVAGGARGVVLDSQLCLVREVRLPRETAAAVARMDGSETVVVGGYRVFTRPDLAPVQGGDIGSQLGTDLHSQLLPIGQEGALAGPFADRFATAGGVIQAVANSITAHLTAAISAEPLSPGEKLGRGIRLPVVQGPMTRVSDNPEFAEAVAEGGGLPFLALAVMTGDQVRRLLTDTAGLLGDRPWGVGILGFTPPEIREIQLAAVRDIAPPYAIIAGGRPSQAVPLEKAGISTYLHVPSPGLLDRFLKEGARKFVFEGFECGGHIGPRASFPLWETQIEHLLSFGQANPESFAEMQVLFAGGINDERSAAMVAAAAATLVERGASIGVLMGTAYLFTEEAVRSGAIQPGFQIQAIACAETVLLETSPGHSTRCASTPYVDAFLEAKRRLIGAGVTRQDMWIELEQLNLGRLRIASKGLNRQGDELVAVDAEAQRRDGMYMIGQVAALRGQITTIEELHQQVTTGATEFLSARAAELRVGGEPASTSPEPSDIAIVGAACVFPKALDADQFWANVIHGVDAITEVEPGRWDPDLYYEPQAFRDPQGKTPSKWGGFIPQVPFDPLRYGIPPASLTGIDAVQLLSLEVAARALADAGYSTRPFDRERTSVIFGAEAGTDLATAYGMRSSFPSYFGPLPDVLDEHLPRLTEDSFAGVLANVIAGRIANRLNLGGVNYTVDAACAASLAALDIAVKELSSGTSDMVLCGGADLHNGISDYLLFASVHALSPSGRCATFDSSADGISLGEGIACIVLKRLADAERDGDRIYAVVKAISGSSDGRSLGLTAPRREGQRLALERAYAKAGVSPAQVGLLEAHGTGTVVGDRTELAALTETFSEAGAETGACVLGSVKSEIGHTKCAAGLAGLIKTAYSLHHGVRPGTIHLTDPNPYWDAETSPFQFNSESMPWAAPPGERYAGVSAFGFGGTNFHAVLAGYDGAPEPAHGLAEWPAELLLFRGSDRDAARREVARLSELIAANNRTGRQWRLRDLAYTLSAQAPDAPVQAGLVATDLDDLEGKINQVASFTPGDGVVIADGDDDSGKVAFLFPGQGSQRPGMLADLFITFPRLQRLLRMGGGRYAPIIFPPNAFTKQRKQAQLEAITDTRAAQPALGIAGLALYELLGMVGVRPDMAGGHSYGELVALAAAGCMGEEDLIELSEERAKAILEAAGSDAGGMAAVRGSAAEVGQALRKVPDVVMANLNSPTQTVISGPTAALDGALTMLKQHNLPAKRLQVACAFHSPVVAGGVKRLAAVLAGRDMPSPSFPVWSNTTAEPFDGDLRSAVAGQLAEPVRFVEQIEGMHRDGARIFVEVGPGRVLSKLVNQTLGDRPHTTVACDSPGDNGIRALLLALAKLATSGVALQLEPLFAGRSQIVSAATPMNRPGWLVDGRTVRRADGEFLPGGLRPANSLPKQSLPQMTSAAVGDHEAIVASFLSATREIIAAQRDVVLAFLGASAPAQIQAQPVPTIVEATVTDQLETAQAREPVADLGELLLDVISERTGYPRDMLQGSLDLEADLSIDSIKRAEIVGELAERLGFSATDGAIDEEIVEELAALKTIDGIVAWIGDNVDLANSSIVRPAALSEDGPHAEAPAGEPKGSESASERAMLRRYVVEVVEIEQPFAVPEDPEPGNERFLIIDDERGIALELASLLEALGANVQVVDDDGAWDETDCVVHLGALKPGGERALPGAYGGIRQALLSGATSVVVATGSAGTFGVGWQGDGQTDPSSGAGLYGLIRTIAEEFPEVLVRAVDVDTKEEPGKVAAHLLAELQDHHAPTVVGYTNGKRTTLRVVESPLDAGSLGLSLDLGTGSVVLLTGGGKGITAQIAIALAEATGCHIELVGRTPAPEGPEDLQTAAAEDQAALRRCFVEQGLRNLPEVESRVRATLAEREIRRTLEALAKVAASVRYHPVDVRDAAAVLALVGDIYARHGRLDGVIHGAGTNSDAWLRDKSPESFTRVFETKVAGGEALARALRPGLGFFVLFGSASGVFGNRGQADYAAANDALDTLAGVWRHQLGARVVAIDWGPWSSSIGGMVSTELEREYARRGISTIDPQEGRTALLKELALGQGGPSQVLYTTTLGLGAAGEARNA